MDNILMNKFQNTTKVKGLIIYNIKKYDLNCEHDSTVNNSCVSEYNTDTRVEQLSMVDQKTDNIDAYTYTLEPEFVYEVIKSNNSKYESLLLQKDEVIRKLESGGVDMEYNVIRKSITHILFIIIGVLATFVFLPTQLNSKIYSIFIISFILAYIYLRDKKWANE
jgi:uncharacterized membrane protein